MMKRLVFPSGILILFILTGCASSRPAARIEIPFESPEDAESALSLFPAEQVEEVASWFPVEVLGCPVWETVDLSNLPDESLTTWVLFTEIRLLDIKVRGCQSTPSTEDAQIILDAVKSVYFPSRPLRLEYIEGEEALQAAWLASRGREVRLPPRDLGLYKQELPLNREIVRRINEIKGEDYIDRVYVALWIAHWNF